MSKLVSGHKELNIRKSTSLTFWQAALPVAALLLLILYGLVMRPLFLQLPAFPLEILFILAATFAIAELMWLGYSWKELQQSIIARLSQALPAFLILFSVGLIIGSWMISGTIPMLVYYGLKIINPNFLYLFAFIVPAIFSTLTGTSWGSAGSIGIVLIGIAGAMGGHMGITAGAVVGGAYFGDKLSPLSDSTNMAALAAEVDLYDHIYSMLYTTVPSALCSLILFTMLGFVYPPEIATGGISGVAPLLATLSDMFAFNPLLLLPPLLVLYASLRKKPTVPTLIVSSLLASVLALLFQSFDLAAVLQSLYKGFHVSMSPLTHVSSEAMVLLNRGGLYALSEAVIVAFMVFVYIGALDHVQAIPQVVNRLFRFANSRRSIVLSSLAAAAMTNAMTSNQYATSFIVSDAFKSKYDQAGISRRVLSRSIEDTGTMLESIVPWTPTAVFMVATLGVAFSDYWHWQLLSLINLMIAPLWAVLGIGMFLQNDSEEDLETK